MKKTPLLIVAICMSLFSTNFTLAQTDTTSYGLNAGANGYRNSNFGNKAGDVTNVAGDDNTFIGYYAGSRAFGSFNVSAGAYSAYFLTSGSENSFLGTVAGFRNKNGNHNLFMGFAAGYANESAGNVMIGDRAGSNNNGFRNIFIGYNTGTSELGSNKLYIDNSGTATPLIYGDFGTKKVGINTKNLISQLGTANLSAYSLYVKGGILTEEVHVTSGWADYVFENDYSLMPIEKVADFIDKNGHLPNIPSAKVVETEGIELADMTKRQQEKIEEIMLYVIKIQKEIDTINQELDKK